MRYRIGITSLGGIKMDTLVINNTVDKTMILPKVSQPINQNHHKNNRINDWVIGEKLNTNSSEAELYYVTNSQTGKKAILKVYRHTVNLAIFEKIKIIRNSHVVKIYDYGFKDGKQFVIEELLDGKSLDKVTESLSKTQLWKLVHDINSGLKVLHNYDIIHKDIKPSNIIWCKGRFVITDFGISIFAKDKVKNYSHTAGYNAPELLYDKNTCLSDYYSFGVVVFYAATVIDTFKNRCREFVYRESIENFTKKVLLSNEKFLASPEHIKRLINGLVENELEYRWGFWDVAKWLFFIPVKKEKHCCKVDFDYQIRTKQDFCNALHNSPEVLLKPLREEEISLYQFLKNENIIKAIIVYRQIHSQKKESQKKYIKWIYDPYFDIKLVNIVKKYF